MMRANCSKDNCLRRQIGLIIESPLFEYSTDQAATALRHDKVQRSRVQQRSALMLLLIKFKTYASPAIHFTLFGCHCQWHMILDATQPNEMLRTEMWYITEISPIREMHFEWDHCNCIWHTSFHPHLSSLASDDGRCAWLNGGDVTTYKVWTLSEWLPVTSLFSSWNAAVVWSLLWSKTLLYCSLNKFTSCSKGSFFEIEMINPLYVIIFSVLWYFSAKSIGRKCLWINWLEISVPLC